MAIKEFGKWLMSAPERSEEESTYNPPNRMKILGAMMQDIAAPWLGTKPTALAGLEEQRSQEAYRDWQRSFKESELSNKKTETDLKKEILKSILSESAGTGAGFPPGTTLTYGGLNIPVSRKFTGEEQRSIQGAENIEYNVNNALSLVDKVITDKGGFSDKFSRSRIDIGNPLFVSGDSETLQSSLNRLKAQIPFAKGGKQLTPFEAKTLFRLLDMTGKEKKTIKSDLKSFVEEFNRLRELAIEGEGVAKKKIGKGLSDKPSSFSNLWE